MGETQVVTTRTTSDWGRVMAEGRIVRNVFSCTKPWDAMPGDQFARNCRTCSRTVYDLTQLQEDEVLRFVAAHDGKVCARIHCDESGYIVNGACADAEAGTVSVTLGEIAAVDRAPRARTDQDHLRAALRRLAELEGRAARKSWRSWDL
jgi:hypothetical protein